MPSKLAADLLKFTESVHQLDTPETVLRALDAITWPDCRVHVLGAALLPLNFGASDSLVSGKTVFLHESVPKGWWEDRTQLATGSPSPSDVAARLALAPFTLSELMKSLEPVEATGGATVVARGNCVTFSKAAAAALKIAGCT